MGVLEFAGPAGWDSWLADHHDTQTETWVRIGKRHADIALPTIDESGELALCFGWIDGQRKAHDEVSFLQRYSRRRPKSSWSKVNVERVESLIAPVACASQGSQRLGMPGQTVDGKPRTSHSAPRACPWSWQLHLWIIPLPRRHSGASVDPSSISSCSRCSRPTLPRRGPLRYSDSSRS